MGVVEVPVSVGVVGGDESVSVSPLDGWTVITRSGFRFKLGDIAAHNGMSSRQEIKIIRESGWQKIRLPYPLGLSVGVRVFCYG